MKKYYPFLLIAALTAILNSCKSNPTSPTENISVDKNTLRQIGITQTGYQSFEISNNDNLVLSSKNISSIILGKKKSGIFNGEDTTSVSYEQTGNNFKLKFDFTQAVDDSVTNNKFTLRYIFSDNSYYDLDTSKVTYKYPYSSTEILLTWNYLLIPPATDIQDFDISDSLIFYHPIGPLGLYEYDMRIFQSTPKISYEGGDFIAASQDYVFCDITHNSIGRYNIALDSLDIMINLSLISDFNIDGLAVYNNKLYVSTNRQQLLTHVTQTYNIWF